MVKRGNSYDHCGRQKDGRTFSCGSGIQRDGEGAQKKRELREGMPEGITV